MKAVLLILVFITSLVISINTCDLVLSDRDEECLSANYDLDFNKLKIINIINYVIYNSKEMLIFLLPVILAFLKSYGQISSTSIFETVLLLFLILEIRTVTTIVLCIYKLSKDSKNTFLKTILLMIRNAIFFFVALFLGKYFSVWFDRFPIISQKVDENVVEVWFNDGANLFLNLFKGFQDIIDINSQLFAKLIILLISLFSLFLLISIKTFMFSKTKTEYQKSCLSKPVEILCKRDLYLKTILLNQNRIYGLGYLLESVAFWTIIGLFSGFMTDIVNTKMIYFFGTSCSIYVTVFLAYSNYSKNINIFALDGEGKKVSFWLDRMPLLFRKKLKIWCINMLVCTLVEYSVLILIVSRWEILLFCIIQFLYSLLLFFFLSFPSILCPYYGYSNIREYRSTLLCRVCPWLLFDKILFGKNENGNRKSYSFTGR
nr:hypothetical protein [Acetitomaculum ruminis]